jgi:hypothetical protein
MDSTHAKRQESPMRHLLVLIVLIGGAATVLAAGGCGRAGSEEDLGTVVFEIPQVPGVDTPFAMPELGADDAAPTPGVPSLPLPGGKE